MRRPVIMGVTLAAALLATAVGAHTPEQKPARELIRIQGYRKTAPPGAAVKRHLVLVALGAEHAFHATDWARYTLTNEPQSTPDPSRLTLQGRREYLATFAQARS